MSVEVISRSTESVGIVSEGSQSSVAGGAKRSTHQAGDMIVVEVQDASPIRGFGWESADVTEVVLFSEHGIDLFSGDTVLLSQPLVPEDFLVGVSPHLVFRQPDFIRDEIPVSLPSCELGLLADASTVRKSGETYGGLALSTVGGPTLGINVYEPMLVDEVSTATESTLGLPILLDGDPSTSTAIGFSIEEVDVVQKMDISPLLGSVSPDVSNVLPLDPPSFRRVVTSNFGSAFASAMALTNLHGAVRGATTSKFHRKDCITC